MYRLAKASLSQRAQHSPGTQSTWLSLYFRRVRRDGLGRADSAEAEAEGARGAGSSSISAPASLSGPWCRTRVHTIARTSALCSLCFIQVSQFSLVLQRFVVCNVIECGAGAGQPTSPWYGGGGALWRAGRPVNRPHLPRLGWRVAPRLCARHPLRGPCVENQPQ